MSCKFENNEAVINKIYEKGFENQKLPVTHEISCSCGENVLMETCITKCKNCDIIFGVTPCSWEDKENIVNINTNL